MKRRVSIVALCAFFVCGLAIIRPHAAVTAPPCPVSLTSPDGQALILEKYDLRVAVHGALSLTEMEMTFRNPEARQMEGRFLYLLPPGATISRFAKEVNGKLMEGEVVEKLRAQSIYTEILHTMRDPALLEMDQGNRFSARVFPIAANGTVRLLLGYSQVLTLNNGERKLTIPMAGMPKIGEFTFTLAPCHERMKASTGIDFLDPISNEQIEHHPMTIQRKAAGLTPKEDISMTFALDPKMPSTHAIKSGNYQMLQYRPDLSEAKIEMSAMDWAFYVDTSASNADTEQQRLQALGELLSVQRSGVVNGYAFDVEVKQIFTTVGKDTEHKNMILPLRARHALGATNLTAAMKHIGENARATKTPTRFVLVSDGIATLGAREPRDVIAALGEWPSHHTLHALVIGGKQDEKMLNAIVEKTKGRVIQLPYGENLKENAAAANVSLNAMIGATVEFYDEGAEWIYPRSFRDVIPGSELIVFSELKPGAVSKPGAIIHPSTSVRGPNSDARKLSLDFSVKPAEIADYAPLLQREAYRTKLDYLEKQEQSEAVDAKRAELRKQRLEISVKTRVLCPLTSLLVLETENDYARFGIERTALADIMQVGANGIELRKRGAADLPPPTPAGKQVEARKKGRNAAPAKDGPELLEKSAELKDKADDDRAGGEGQLHRLSEVNELNGLRRELRQSGGAGGAAHDAAPDPSHPTAGLPPPAPSIASPRPAATPATAAEAPATAAPRVQDATARRNAPAQAKLERPVWTAQYGNIPTEEQLNTLRAKVQGAPRDRTLRNAYADALKKAQRWDSLQGEAFEWLPFDPENPQVFEYLGNSATGLKDDELALRAITSIAEVAPNRAALLARAGWLLLVAKKYEMAREMFTEALKNRKDDANIYRGLAYSYWLNKDFDNASKTLEDALKVDFNNRYGDVKRVINEEMGYITRSKKAANGEKSASAPDAIRVTLAWETDANDVDLHVVDPSGEECSYSHKNTKAGLELYSDQTQGLGPEVIRAGKVTPGIYHVGVNYFSAGPMGVSRGVVVIMQPKDGVVEEPVIVPFCLIPGGPDMRHLGAAEFK